MRGYEAKQCRAVLIACDRVRVDEGLCDTAPPITHHVEALPALPLLIWKGLHDLGQGSKDCVSLHMSPQLNLTHYSSPKPVPRTLSPGLSFGLACAAHDITLQSSAKLSSWPSPVAVCQLQDRHAARLAAVDMTQDCAQAHPMLPCNDF